jgi:hypothetical protein
MKATIKTFESGAGDCEFFILRDEQTNQSLHIMIDCNVLTNEIKGYIVNVLNQYFGKFLAQLHKSVAI